MFQHIEKQKRLSPIVANSLNFFAILIAKYVCNHLHFLNHGCTNSLKHETFMYIHIQYTYLST